MKYITGMLAFAIPCNQPSCGLWDFPNSEFRDNFDKYIDDTDNHPGLGKTWIETDKVILQRKDGELYNVATHLRAYLDMLYAGKYEELTGLFERAIGSTILREKLFAFVYNHRGQFPAFKKISEFFDVEFGNAWYSYVSSVDEALKSMIAAQEREEKVKQARKEKYGKGDK